jgi:hypothetical protein
MCVIAFVFITPDITPRETMPGPQWFYKPPLKKGGGRVHEIGEVSTTDDGNFMYFVYQVKNGPSNYDNGIGFTRRTHR